MDPELIDEWTALEHSVRLQFRDSEFGPTPAFETVLMFVALPAFNNYQHIAINRINNHDELSATLTTWDRSRDQAAFYSPVERMKYPRSLTPTITSEPIEKPSEEFSRIISFFSGVHIPISNVEYRIGMDGASYELQLGSGFGWCRLRWWGPIPDDWRQLSDGIEMLQALMESEND